VLKEGEGKGRGDGRVEESEAEVVESPPSQAPSFLFCLSIFIFAKI